MIDRVRVAAVAPSAVDYAAEISAAWQKAVVSILKTGRLLIEAKKALGGHGKFTLMIERRLPFGERTAEILMELARHPVIANPKFISVLPPSWGTLHAIIKLPVPQDELEMMLLDGTLGPDTSRAEVEDLKNELMSSGVYAVDRVPRLLNDLITFARKWPDDCSIVAARVIDDERGVPLDDVANLSAWINKLHAECERIEEQQ
jgi:hypothetical protein